MAEIQAFKKIGVIRADRTQQHVLLFQREERVKPVQQQLSHSRLSKVVDAPIQPPLKGVWVIGSQCCNQFCQQEQRDAAVMGQS